MLPPIPSALACSRVIVPARIIIDPVLELLPERLRIPEPFLVKEPVPLIMPESVWLLFEPKIKAPEFAMLPE